MKERPILFSAPMVIALRAGRKTQTRRIVKSQPPPDSPGLVFSEPYSEIYGVPTWFVGWGNAVQVSCPHGMPGDRLWVKETFAEKPQRPGTYAYRATDARPRDYRGRAMKWKPSIFMPRVASRIALELAAVRVERLHDISEADAQAEGVRPFFETYDCIGRDQVLPGGTRCSESPYRASYEMLWEEINGDGSWLANPWVWVETFARVNL